MKSRSGYLIEAPFFEQGAKQWLAKIKLDPSSPGGLARDFCRKGRGPFMYECASLHVGEAVEFGCKSVNDDRAYFVVKELQPDAVVFAEYRTCLEACDAASEVQAKTSAPKLGRRAAIS